MIVLDLVNLGRGRILRTIFEGNLNRFSVINEERGAGCFLVHAINATNGSSLSDHCFGYYRLHYKYTDHSNRRVTFAISKSYRVICRVFEHCKVSCQHFGLGRCGVASQRGNVPRAAKTILKGKEGQSLRLLTSN